MVRTSLREIIRCLDEQKQLYAKLLDDGLESPDVLQQITASGLRQSQCYGNLCAYLDEKLSLSRPPTRRH